VGAGHRIAELFKNGGRTVGLPASNHVDEMTFFEKYSYKQKNYALLVLIVLLMAVAWKRAFSITVETLDYRQELEMKLMDAQTADSDIRSRQMDIARLNRYLGEENNTVEKVQQGFLNFFAEKGAGLQVHQIDEVLNFKHPDFEINTHRIVLRGDYTSTLRFVYALEKEFTLGKLLNVSFELKRFSMEEDKHLYTTLLIQNYMR
jgi:hypothetical protein